MTWNSTSFPVYSGGNGGATWSSNAIGETIVVTAKSTPPPNPWTIKEVNGQLVATREQHTIRFLFDDGTTLDIVTYQDDSVLREAILAYAHKERIMGSAYLPSSTNGTEEKPRKRTVKKAQ